MSYYFLDDDPEWLRRLGEARQVFKEKMKRANSTAETNEQKEALKRIESRYAQNIAVKDRVISSYKMGNQAEGAALHKSMRNNFLRVLELCEEYKNLYTAGIRRMRDDGEDEAQRLRIMLAINGVGYGSGSPPGFFPHTPHPHSSAQIDGCRG